jgi:glucose/sorbosone dehydrogenase
VLLLTIAATLALPAVAPAASLVPIAPGSAWSGTPVHAASPPGDARLFVVELQGAVRLVKEGGLQATPFLTVPNVDIDGERGLLSIAFSPDYATSGLFYVFTVAAGPDALDPSGSEGDLRVVEYRRSSSNPDLANPASARLVLKQPHSSTASHNGGQLAFGPDGLLYITTGDAADSSNSQSLANDLGKVLRIDPRDPPGEATFSVPPSNPFVATMGTRPEIYSLGLRNPYRASFGPGGDLIVPDVGQESWEEVNLGRAAGAATATTLAGANLGWPICEGVCMPPNPSYVDPIFQYSHGPGPTETTGCAIIGGYVVRDPALVGLTGRYLYGDFCRSDLRTLDLDAAADPQPAGLSIPPEGGSLFGFGEDGRGCVYVMGGVTVYRVAASPTAGAACLATMASNPATTAADATPPRLRLTARRQRLRRFVQLFAICNEACALRAAGTLRISAARASALPRLIVATRSTRGGEWVRLRMRLPNSPFAQARQAARDGRKVVARIAVTATDPSGNRSRKALRIRLIAPSSQS